MSLPKALLDRSYVQDLSDVPSGLNPGAVILHETSSDLEDEQALVTRLSDTMRSYVDLVSVRKTGDETVAGTKTFSATIVGSVTGNAETATKVVATDTSGTYVGGCQGLSAIKDPKGAGAFFPITNYVSTNGSMCLFGYQNHLGATYAVKENVDAGTNTMAKTAKLLDESGNASWPGTVTAGGFSGTATNATKWAGGAKTVSTGAPSGGAANDVWFRYS